jgi:hypothetical protein
MTSKKAPKTASRKSNDRPQSKAPKKKPLVPAKGALKSAKPKPAARAGVEQEDVDGQGGPTSPTELSAEVMEFITAIDKYKRANRRPFPSWSEVFEVVKALGYQRSA